MQVSGVALAIELWCTDYKGEFLLDNRQYCYPLTVTETTKRIVGSLSATSMLPRVALPYCRDFSHPNRTPRIAIFRRVRSEAQPLGQVSNP